METLHIGDLVEFDPISHGYRYAAEYHVGIIVSEIIEPRGYDVFLLYSRNASREYINKKNIIQISMFLKKVH